MMIVEFSDYQCPYCHQVESVIKDLLAKYGDKVSLAYRDLPLKQIHPQAQVAAEASPRDLGVLTNAMHIRVACSAKGNQVRLCVIPGLTTKFLVVNF